MTHYYLHLYNRIGFVRDEEGQDAPDLDGAREAAIQAIRGIVSHEAKAGRIDLAGRIEIADETGRLLACVPFSEALTVQLDETNA